MRLKAVTRRKWCHLLYFLFKNIEFIRVTLVNEMMLFSGVQFYNTSSVVFSTPSQVSFHHHLSPLYTLFYFSHTPFPLIITIQLSVSMRVFFLCWIPSPLSLLNPLPPNSCQFVLCIYESVSILFVSLFCSLYSTYKWSHMVLVFLWVAYFNHFILN